MTISQLVGQTLLSRPLQCSGFFAVTLLILLPGCGEAPRGGPRVATSSLTGLVLVDGEPASTLQVRCTPVTTATVPTAISAFTDTAGNFSVGTYEAGDGAPPGEYRLTFFWGQYGMSGRYDGPDKLGKKYADVESSEFTATVKEGEPCDLGVITLSTK